MHRIKPILHVIPARYRAVKSGLLLAALLFVGITISDARPLDDVIEKGELVVFVYDDFPPYSFLEADQLTGIDVDLAHEMARDLGVKLRFIVRGADENVDDDLRANIWKGPLLGGGGVADVMLHVPYHVELKIRNEFVAFFGQYYSETISVAADPQVIGTSETLVPFTAASMAVELDSVPDFFMSSAFRGRLRASTKRFRYFQEAATAYNNNETSGLMAPTTQLEWALAQGTRESRVFQPPMPGIMLSQWNLGIAVKHDSRDLGYALEDTIFRLQAEDGKGFKDIFSKYHTTYHPPKINDE